MYDTLNRPSTTAQQQTRRGPRRITKIMCTLATIKSAYVVVLLLSGGSIGLSRLELIHVFCAAILGFPALYLLAQDMLAAPSSQERAKVFRLGLRIGRFCRVGPAYCRS
ncbi:hypothetical protein [Micromonospora cathayae]|uniref:Uncharacterized protein n=1 Tax=Micromonospora cathayae TaxID=3028804 RepID=A0ABY7ZVS2_9ACTN|nr:hypothetical protein [Micromonospora sp. HUAS 3]WDZ87156.1 hypothetical protein PVK37_12510 [Micromonospora sp. HUAS 3]